MHLDPVGINCPPCQLNDAALGVGLNMRVMTDSANTSLVMTSPSRSVISMATTRRLSALARDTTTIL